MKALIAEDDAVFRLKLHSFLTQWGYEPETCDNGAEAWRRMQLLDGPNLVLLDCLMPEMDGRELCRKIRNREGFPYVYIIMLSAMSQQEDIIEGVHSGADDYVIKPFHPDELRARLAAGRRILELQEQLLASREMLRVQTTEDALTRLLNWRGIMDTLHQEMSRTRRAGTPVGVMMIDLDHFKSINDQYGHPAGNEVLREIARRLGASVRIYDTIGRYGGEEFLAVMPGCNLSTMVKLAERLRIRILEEPMGAEKINVTVSIGVAVSGREEYLDPESILQAADQALYRAKSLGRNRVECYPIAVQLSAATL